MNIIGLFFTFMIPGIVLGALAAAVLSQRQSGKAKKDAMLRGKRALYVYDMREGEESRRVA